MIQSIRPHPSSIKKPQSRTSLTHALNRRSQTPIIAICHLSWEWVWQRPQQFLSRLARKRPLLFVELHCADVLESAFSLRTWEENPQVRILKMQLPAHRWADGRFIDGERRRILIHVLALLDGEFDRAILWMNDPMAVTAYVGHLGESAVVYDCMDELSQFANAPAGLIEREQSLVEAADVIFCGGQKMRRKRLPSNPNTHFYGTGVDCRHFGQARKRNAPVHPEISMLDGAVLGYFGVIDERIDYELLAALADADPSWHVVMVGPYAKIDPAHLPQRPNLHWLGGKPYAELPSLTAGMDVCMMPFALNAATEYINPTKALEYMAAGKPVVSTALDEVRFNFSAAARIAADHQEFIRYCREEVLLPDGRRIMKGLKLAADNTWESIAEKMDGHLHDLGNAHRDRRAYGKASGQSSNPEATAAHV